MVSERLAELERRSQAQSEPERSTPGNFLKRLRVGQVFLCQNPHQSIKRTMLSTDCKNFSNERIRLKNNCLADIAKTSIGVSLTQFTRVESWISRQNFEIDLEMRFWPGEFVCSFWNPRLGSRKFCKMQVTMSIAWAAFCLQTEGDFCCGWYFNAFSIFPLFSSRLLFRWRCALSSENWSSSGAGLPGKEVGFNCHQKRFGQDSWKQFSVFASVICAMARRVRVLFTRLHYSARVRFFCLFLNSSWNDLPPKTQFSFQENWS